MQDQIAVTDVGRRELVIERSQKVSRALHDAARKARQNVRGGAIWQPGFSRARRGSRTFALASALVVFVLPTLIFAVYIGLIASDQYEVEVRFAVRNREALATDILGTLTGMPKLQQAQDSLVVNDYVRSRAIVEKVDAEIGLRAIYGRAGIDYFARVDPTEPIEEFVKTWSKYVKIDTEMPSGIIVLKVRAFSPEETLKVAKAVVAASEGLVNELSSRSRQDAVAKAQEEVTRAEQRLAAVREQVRATRDRAGLIDPKKSSEEILKTLSELRLERIKLQNEIQVSSRSLAPTSSQIQNLNARLDAVSGQIATLERSVTAQGGSAGTLSQSYTQFDRARLDQEWVEKYYQTVAGSLERARIEAERQQVYLTTFVPPTLPEEAEYPRRLWLMTLVAVGSAGLWLLLNYIRSITVA